MIVDTQLGPKIDSYIITKLSPVVVNWQHLQATEIIIFLVVWLTTAITHCLHKLDSDFSQHTNLVASDQPHEITDFPLPPSPRL